MPLQDLPATPFFLTQFSSQFYPWVWLATVPLNLFVIYVYNRFLPKIGPLRFLLLFAFLSALINLCTGIFHHLSPFILFFQYAWKDIYVLLMLKQLWSMIHSTIAPSRAKYLYGSIYGVGTIGAICGSMVPAMFASLIGSDKILFLTLPAYLILFLFYSRALHYSPINVDTFEKELTADPRPKEAFSLIRRTPILLAVLGLVIFMQASVALMEYQFNSHLEINILDQDLRTAYYGKLMGSVNLLSLALQFFGGVFVIRFLGLKGSHFLVPTLLCSSALLYLFIPSFAMISFSYVFLKGLEFSLFGVIREMLYVPLALDAKYRAKAVIDVFAYRTSKAMIALAILLLQSVAGSMLLTISNYVSIALFIGWLVTVSLFFRKRFIEVEA